MKINKRDIWTIPNMIGYARVLLIPVFVWFYMHGQYSVSACIVLISTCSDFFDGMIARKFNMVTDLGKIIDPVADKLTHFAMVVCLIFRYPLMKWLMLLMICKEGYMAYEGARFLKKGKMLDGANMKGKICTASLFISLFVLFLFPNISNTIANTIIVVLMGIMAYTWFDYIRIYKKMKEDFHA